MKPVDCGDSDFAPLLNSYLAKNPGAEREIADEFEFLASSVRWWASGKIRPHPRIVKLITTYIKNKSQAD